MALNFVSTSDEMCAGLLVKGDAESCRRIMYKVEDGASDDLRYCTLNYEIERIQPKIDVVEGFKIYHHVNLGPLIPYINHIGDRKNLTQKDIYYIFNALLKNERWLERNKALFINKTELVPSIIYFNLREILKATKQYRISEKEPNYEYAKKRK